MSETEIRLNTESTTRNFIDDKSSDLKNEKNNQSKMNFFKKSVRFEHEKSNTTKKSTSSSSLIDNQASNDDSLKIKKNDSKKNKHSNLNTNLLKCFKTTKKPPRSESTSLSNTLNDKNIGIKKSQEKLNLENNSFENDSKENNSKPKNPLIILNNKLNDSTYSISQQQKSTSPSLSVSPIQTSFNYGDNNNLSDSNINNYNQDSNGLVNNIIKFYKKIRNSSSSEVY
jgi:hypothetical protein